MALRIFIVAAAITTSAAVAKAPGAANSEAVGLEGPSQDSSSAAPITQAAIFGSAAEAAETPTAKEAVVSTVAEETHSPATAAPEEAVPVAEETQSRVTPAPLESRPAPEEAVKIQKGRHGDDEFKLEAAGATVIGVTDQAAGATVIGVTDQEAAGATVIGVTDQAIKIKKGRHSDDEFNLQAAGATVIGVTDQVPAPPPSPSEFLANTEQSKALDGRHIGASKAWFGVTSLISIGLVALGIALCTGLGKRIEKEELQETGAEMYTGRGFVPGALVTVTKAFMSNGEPPVQLRLGQTGVIQKIDAVGDALIRFADHSASQWVYEQNYQHLRVR